MGAEGHLEDDQLAPLRVHVASSDVKLAPDAPAQVECAASFFTLVLTADNPFGQILPTAPSRDYAIIQSLDKTIVLSDSRGSAQAPGNIGDATLASPSGALVPVGVVVPIRQANEVWASASEFPARVSVIAAYR